MKISIVVPCYNASKYIEECITSIFNQTYKNIEVIAIDNESKDNTLEVLNKLQAHYKDLIIGTAKNIYPRCWDEPREAGFNLATGEYLTLVCADDYIDKAYIEDCVRYLKQDTEKIKLFQSGIRGFTISYGMNDSSFLRGKKSFQEPVVHQYSNLKRFKEICLSFCPVSSPTVFYRSDLWREGLLKTYPEIYSGAADYDLYCRLADNDIFIYPSKKWLGYNYRWHEKQATWEMHAATINYDKLIKDFWREKWK